MPTGGSVSAGVLAMVLVGAFGGAVAGLWNLLIASLIGALAGHELAVDIRSPPVLTLIGAASGVIAAVLIAGSLVTVVWARNQPRNG